jgi:hypothetical protein
MYSLDCVFVEPEPEIQKGVWCSTSASVMDANIVVSKANSNAFNPYFLSFIFNLALCYSWLCIRLIGVV